MFRQTIFWLHLICGVGTGLVVLMMSVTGVLLTYERQIVAAAEWEPYAAPTAAAEPLPLPLEELLAAAKLAKPDFTPTTIMLRNEVSSPVTLGAGRNGTLLANPYTGAVTEPGATRLRAFFAAVTGWHRWFNASGDHRSTARAVTGASNLAFLFLVLSGIYLWLPRMWKWAAFKTHLLFNAKATTSKARDFNWHHVFGIWSALPLAVIVATAVVFSYPWANDLVYRSVGEEPPVRGGPPGGAPPGGRAGAPSAAADEPANGSAPSRLPYTVLVARAAAHGEWQTLTLNLPADPAAATLRIAIDQGNGGQPQLRHTLTLDAFTGEVTTWAPFSSQSVGQQARNWIRFLHTGEALGIVGQTLAGLVSLTSVLMVWTGLALAWRRLIVPLYRRKA